MLRPRQKSEVPAAVHRAAVLLHTSHLLRERDGRKGSAGVQKAHHPPVGGVMGATLQRAAQIFTRKDDPLHGPRQLSPPVRNADGEGGALLRIGRRSPLRAGVRAGLRSQ